MNARTVGPCSRTDKDISMKTWTPARVSRVGAGPHLPGARSAPGLAPGGAAQGDVFARCRALGPSQVHLAGKIAQQTDGVWGSRRDFS
eukprot:1554566-Pyramimonas_sp.AAC.1